MHDGSEYATGCRGRAEIEAESVAYSATPPGSPPPPYSFGYVAHWSGGDPAAVKDTAERVVTTARTIVERIGVLAEPLQTPEAVAA